MNDLDDFTDKQVSKEEICKNKEFIISDPELFEYEFENCFN